MATSGKSVGEDLLRSASLDMFPMPHTCVAFGILEEPSILTALRLKSSELGITAEKLDQLAKEPSPKQALKDLLGLSG